MTTEKPPQVDTGVVLVQGGAGDFLQCLPFLLANRTTGLRIFVATHLPQAGDFFRELGITVERLETFRDLEGLHAARQSLARAGSLVDCPRAHFFKENPFPERRSPFHSARRTIGIQLSGSRFSADCHQRFKGIPKALPPAFLEGLLAQAHNFLLFGTEEEIRGYGVAERENLRFVHCPRIAESLSQVSSCDLFIGSDSAFKSMSVMLGIPTLVLLGDYADDFRDAMFINPYTACGAMHVVRYRNLLDRSELDSALRIATGFIEEKLLRHAIHVVSGSQDPVPFDAFHRRNRHLPSAVPWPPPREPAIPDVSSAGATPGAAVQGAVAAPSAHIESWKRCVELGRPVIVCEDRASLHFNFLNVVHQIVSMLGGNFDLIAWGWDADGGLGASTFPFTGGFEMRGSPVSAGQVLAFQAQPIACVPLRLHRVTRPHCYSISPRGATRLLDRMASSALRSGEARAPSGGTAPATGNFDLAVSALVQDASGFAAFPPPALCAAP